MSSTQREIAKLVCFLVGHDPQLIQMVCRNQTRWICRRCPDPFSDTLKDKVLQLRQLWERLRNQGVNSDDEFPF